MGTLALHAQYSESLNPRPSTSHLTDLCGLESAERMDGYRCVVRSPEGGNLFRRSTSQVSACGLGTIAASAAIMRNVRSAGVFDGEMAVLR